MRLASLLAALLVVSLCNSSYGQAPTPANPSGQAGRGAGQGIAPPPTAADGTRGQAGARGAGGGGRGGNNADADSRSANPSVA